MWCRAPCYLLVLRRTGRGRRDESKLPRQAGDLEKRPVLEDNSKKKPPNIIVLTWGGGSTRSRFVTESSQAPCCARRGRGHGLMSSSPGSSGPRNAHTQQTAVIMEANCSDPIGRTANEGAGRTRDSTRQDGDDEGWQMQEMQGQDV